MPLDEGQWQVRDLVLGPGTSYRLMDESNPFVTTVRADQGGPRAWNHGSWSGAEWANERVVPMRILVDATDLATWRTAHQQLAAAFAPVADAVVDVELRFAFGGEEYLLTGRPRMVEPDLTLAATGRAFARAAFVAQDPRIYSGVEHTTGAVPLPTQVGGMTVPLTVPFVVSGTVVGGSAAVANVGTTDTSMLLRIDGPVADPRVTLQRPDGSIQTLTFSLTIPTGQWVEVDSAARTAFVQGLPEASVRGQVAWDMDPYPLQPGTTTLRFSANDFQAGTVTATWRDAWW